jgi:uncharacterized caspase-like protein
MSFFRVTFAVMLLLWAGSFPCAGQDQAPHKYALLIGINSYAAEIVGVPKLKFAGNDADEMRKALLDRGWDRDDIRVFNNERATRSAIVGELERLGREARQQDIVLIFFAGHGLRDRPNTDRGGVGHTYWLTFNASLQSLAVEGIRLNHLMEYVGDIHASTKIVVLDHCYSGDVETLARPTGGSRDAADTQRVTRNLFPKDEFDRVVKSAIPEGLVVMGAAREEAYEFPELKHGLFTYAFLEALRKPDTDTDHDGKISVAELWAAAKKELDEIATKKGIKQSPLHVVQGTNVLEWKLFDAQVDAAREAGELRSWLTRLSNEAGIDNRILAHCFGAISNLEQSMGGGQAISERDRKIIEEIKSVRSLDGSITAAIMRQVLETKVRGLTQ